MLVDRASNFNECSRQGQNTNQIPLGYLRYISHRSANMSCIAGGFWGGTWLLGISYEPDVNCQEEMCQCPSRQP